MKINWIRARTEKPQECRVNVKTLQSTSAWNESRSLLVSWYECPGLHGKTFRYSCYPVMVSSQSLRVRDENISLVIFSSHDSKKKNDVNVQLRWRNERVSALCHRIPVHPTLGQLIFIWNLHPYQIDSFDFGFLGF